MNLYMSFAAQKTNDVMKVLTIFSVFFMPLTFIVGIYGMNFDFMPELNQKWGYPAVILLMVIITVIIYQWFKRKNGFRNISKLLTDIFYLFLFFYITIKGNRTAVETGNSKRGRSIIMNSKV